MALSDPQSLTINGTAVALARTGMALDSGTFASVDRSINLIARHSTGKRSRHNIVLKKDATVADPFIPSQNRPVQYQVSLTVDLPSSGVGAADAAELAKALVAWATPANVTKLIGGES